MLTSLLAYISVTVKFKTTKLIFMNENINPPCNSLLATFFEKNFDVGPKRPSFCLKTLVRPKRTLSQLFELLFPFLMSPMRILLEREAKTFLWEVQWHQSKKAVCARRRLVWRQM